MASIAAQPPARRGGRRLRATPRPGSRRSQAAGFEKATYEVARWDYHWDTAGIRALYGTFSPIARLAEERRTEILDGIARIADEQFDGRVGRTLLTALYTARKPA